MLRRIEKANLHCIWSDVKIYYDDGQWREIKLNRDVWGNFSIPYKPVIRKFMGRKAHAKKIGTRFTVTLIIGKYAEIVEYKNSHDHKIFSLENWHNTPDELLDLKAQEFIKTHFIDKSFEDPIHFTFNAVTQDEDYWLFEGKYYKDTENLKADEVKALLQTRNRLRKARINRAKTISSTPELPIDGQRRGFIPEDIRLLVWERDGGKCAKCGSRNELQYDHIIPFSLGGSSGAENLQILCGTCNRNKSNSVA